jgi:hypothetical protein
MKVTMFKDVKSQVPVHINLEKALHRITTGGKNGNLIPLIEEIRKGDKSKKNELPIVLFSGEFGDRKDQSLFNHSGYIVLDFDHVSDVDGSKRMLSTDDYVYSCWVSPSGNGLKALVEVTNPERHRDHFRALQSYFMKQYNLELDSSGINEARACFESYDPDAIIKDSSKKFGAFLSERSEAGQDAHNDNVYTDYMKLNIAAKMVRAAADGEKHAVLLKAANLCGGYIASGRMEEDEVVRVLFREISRHELRSEQEALDTITRGIEHGKTMPLRDLINNEQDIEREMRINDGDMSFISSDDADRKMIEDFVSGKIPVGLDTGCEKIDQHFRYKKDLTIFNGHSNVGKTTVCMYMMVNASVRHGWKWVVYSSENTTWSVKMTLMEFAVGRAVGSMNYDQRKTAYKWVNDHFTVINNSQVYSYSDIILFIEKVRTLSEIDAAFIDPYNSLKIENNGNNIGVHDYHYEAISEFLTYATSKNMAVWVNMHAVTEAQRRKGEDGLPIAPFAEDTEGGGKFVNRADCFVTIHRKIQAGDPDVRRTTEIHVRKVREVKTGGSPTPYDDPILIQMDRDMTAFRSMHSHDKLFKSIDTEFVNYRSFDK